MKNKLDAVVIAGTASGSGKTTITCAILGMLKNKKLSPISYKCGPDYIDPMFHSKIIDVNSANLDQFFYPQEHLNAILLKGCENDIAVIEGVMGFYDGLGIDTVTNSTYDIARKIDCPVILAVNCKGTANSAVAIIKGFYEYKKDNKIKGVILNNITKNTYELLKPVIEEEFNGKIKVCGYLPKLPSELMLESRHLGLVTANEISGIKEKLAKLANFANESIDLDAIIAISKEAPIITHTKSTITPVVKDIKIGIAKDDAFCFYYDENLSLLEELGAKLVYFSPLKDSKIPADIDGFYIGGGYPELHAKKLSQNKSMLASINEALENNLPCIAECGGFMYLTSNIDGQPMVDFIKTDCFNTGKLSRFGYVTLKAVSDNLLVKEGEEIKGHEFHYYDSDSNGEGFVAMKSNGKEWDCVHSNEYLYAGFPHLSFLSNIDMARNFLIKCFERKNNNGKV